MGVANFKKQVKFVVFLQLVQKKNFLKRLTFKRFISNVVRQFQQICLAPLQEDFEVFRSLKTQKQSKRIKFSNFVLILISNHDENKFAHYI